KRGTDHRATAEAHDRESRCHATVIRKPFDERGHGRDIAETQPDTADDAGAEPHEPELVEIDADRTEHEAAGPTERGHHSSFARTNALEPSPPDRSRYAKDNEKKRVHPTVTGNAPIAGSGEELINQGNARTRNCFGEADGARRRQPKHAEAVRHADAQMDAKRGRGHEPAIKSCSRNNPLAIEQADRAARLSQRLSNAHH